MGLNLQGFVSLDGSGFENGLRRIEGAAGRVGDTLKGLALSAIGIYGVEQAIGKTVETAEKLIDTANRLGVPLEKLQELGFAAKQSGSDIDTLTGFIEKLNSARVDPKKFESFTKLGISQPDLSSLKVEDLILKLSANLQNRSPQEVIGPLREIGGRAAGQLIPMLRENLDEMAESAHKLGVIMKTEDVVMLKFMADEMQTLASIIISDLAPAIVAIETFFLRLINVAKASGSFLGTMAGGTSGKDWRTALDAFLHPFSVTPERKAAVDRIRGTLEKAQDAFSLDYAAGDKRIDDMIAELLKKQKERERIGSIPDFETVMPAEKAKHGGSSQVYSDSLLRIGNFLGSGNHPISLAQRHLHVAQQQLHVQEQIARNTQWRPIGGHGGHGLPPV